MNGFQKHTIVSFQSVRASEGESEEDAAPKVASRSVPLEEFLVLYGNSLMNASTLGQSTIDISKRIMADLLRFSFKDQSEESFNGHRLVRVLSTLGQTSSFLRRREDSLSGSYKSKIIIASLRVLPLLKGNETPERWQVPGPLLEETETSLKNLLKRYQKEEKKREGKVPRRKRKKLCSLPAR